MAQRVGRISEVASTKEKKGLVPVSPATVWDLDQVEAFLAQQAGGQQA